MPISGFTPIPLPMMIPFMGLQSAIIGQQFGLNFQYAKRKISAMSNDEFNKLTPQQLQIEVAAQIKAAIPTMQQSIQDMLPLTQTIIAEFGRYLNATIQAVPALTASVSNQLVETFFPTAYGEEATPDPTGQGALDPNAQQYLDQNVGYQTTTSTTSIATNQAIFRAMPLTELLLGINSGRFTGSDLSLAKHVYAERTATKDSTFTPIEPTTDQQAHIAWLANKNYLVTYYLRHKKLHLESTAYEQRWADEANSARQKLVTLSNDYRNPNNSIRESVIQLRQELANNRYPRVQYSD